MGRERVLEIPGLSDLADLAYINLDKIASSKRKLGCASAMLLL